MNMTAGAPEGAMDLIQIRSSQIVLIQDTKGLGTGVVVGPDGWVLTNKHVAPSVGPYRVILANGKDLHGVGVHQSPHHDLAIVKIPFPTESFLNLERDVVEDYLVGEEVFAIGHPRGCRFSVARGIVSNPFREFDKEYYVQTDVSINPGNSGGPLIDRKGRLIGIVSMMLAYSQGLGFAVPGHIAADYVKHVRRLVRQGVVKIPEALLETVQAQVVPVEQIVRNAVSALVEAGKAAIEEEKLEEGYTKLKKRAAIVEVTCKDGMFCVTGQVAAVGSSEKNSIQFLTKLLEVSGTPDLGGASFTLKDNGIHAGILRPVTGLEAIEALWAIDLVLNIVQEWPAKLSALLFTQTSQAAPQGDPGYPLITMPSSDAWKRT